MFGNKKRPLAFEIFPAGTYYVGDPCYPFPNEGPNSELWDELLDVNDYGSVQFVDYRGHRIAMDSTAHGDGCYTGSDGNRYGVDAGMLGILPIALCEFLDPNYMTSVRDLGQVITFDKPFQVTFDNGLFGFGHVHIETNDLDEEDEDDYTFAEDEE